MTMNNEERDNLIRQIAADMQELKGICARHDKTLYGNGTPGLAGIVPLLEQAQHECPARKRAIDGQLASVRQGWLQLWIAIAAFAIAAFSMYRR